MTPSDTINQNGKEKFNLFDTAHAPFFFINKCDYKWERSADLGNTYNYLEACMTKYLKHYHLRDPVAQFLIPGCKRHFLLSTSKSIFIWYNM